jgi:hypothetical protein
MFSKVKRIIDRIKTKIYESKNKVYIPSDERWFEVGWCDLWRKEGRKLWNEESLMMWNKIFDEKHYSSPY